MDQNTKTIIFSKDVILAWAETFTYISGKALKNFSLSIDLFDFLNKLANMEISQVKIEKNKIFYESKEIDLNPLAFVYDLHKFYSKLIDYSALLSIANYAKSKGHDSIPFETLKIPDNEDLSQANNIIYYVLVKDGFDILGYKLGGQNLNSNTIEISIAKNIEDFKPIKEWLTEISFDLQEKLKFDFILKVPK